MKKIRGIEMTLRKNVLYVIFLLFIFLGISIGIVFANLYSNFQSFEKKRSNMISDMEMLINQQVKEGNYKCCIEPACTMCFMGDWLWDGGICRCDDMIANGENDKVCPQCKKGLEEGFCKSTNEKPCDLESEDNFKALNS